MKIIAAVLLLGAVVYARPGKGKGPGLADAGALQNLDGGDKPDEGTKLFMDLVGLCIRLAEENGLARRSEDEVLASFGLVCEAIKNVLDKEIGDGVADKRSMDVDFSGPKSGFGSGFGSGSGKGKGKGKGSGMGSGMGPEPTGEPDSRSMEMGSGRRPRKSGSMDGPSPTGEPDSERSMGPGSGRRPRKSGSMDGPSPTGEPDSERSMGPGSGRRPRKSGSMDGPSPTGEPDSERSMGPGSGSRPGKSGSMDGPSPTGEPDSERSMGPGSEKRRPRKSGSRDGPSPTDGPLSARSVTDGPSGSTFDELVDLCKGFAELAMKMENEKRGKDELEEVLKGMESVCLAAFKEAV